MLDTDVDAVNTTYIHVGDSIDLPVRGPSTINDNFSLRYDPNMYPASGFSAYGLTVSGAAVNKEMGFVQRNVSGTASYPGVLNVGVEMVNNPQQHTFVTFHKIVIEATEKYPCAYFEKSGWLSCPKGGTVTAPMYGGQVVNWTCDGVTYQSGDEIPLVAAQSEFTMSGYIPPLKFVSTPRYGGVFAWVV